MSTVKRVGLHAVHRAQINKMYEQGYTPEQVAQMWTAELDAVLRFWPKPEDKTIELEEDL